MEKPLCTNGVHYFNIYNNSFSLFVNDPGNSLLNSILPTVEVTAKDKLST